MCAESLIGHYRLLHLIGAGGMGDVYVAHDTKLDRRVAIKFLKEDAASGDRADRRLLREARAAAMLDHPNICAIHEIGEDAGRPFIVMQFVEGNTLDRRIAASPPALEEVLTIGGEIADALASAHARGIVHRDIKPANIMITPRGQAKVMDFGLASAAPEGVPADGATESALTAPQTIAGTVPYMSPEQLKGGPVDARSDIFSFGVLLYEVVTGQRPFGGDSTIGTGAAILTSDPLPIARFRADTPGELQRIVGKCLEKNRDRRYQSAADLAVDLRTLLRTIQTGTSASVPASFTSRKGVGPVAATAAMLVVVAIAVGWYLRLRPHVPPASSAPIGSIAVLPFTNSSGNQQTDYLSDGITESIINTFSQLPGLRVMARATVFRYKGKEIDPQQAGLDLGVDAIVTGRVMQQGDVLGIQADLVRVSDGSQLWGERFDRKLADVLAVQDEIAQRITERLRLRLTDDEQQLVTKRYTDSTEAYDLYLKGRFYFARTTEESLERSLSLYQQAIARDPNYALAYVGLAQSYVSLGGVFGFRSPREVLPLGLGAALAAVRLDSKLADAHAVLGSFRLFYEWNRVEAEKELKEAIRLNPNSAAAHNTYGSVYQAVGRFEEAIAERAIAARLDPLSPLALANAGYPHYYARRYDEAIEHYRKAVDLDQRYPWSHLWIGQAYVQKGMQAEAVHAIEEAIRLSGGDTRAKATLAHAYAVAGKRAEAMKILGELETASAQRYVSPYFLALVHVGLNDDSRALAALEAAAEERHPYLTFLNVEPVFARLRGQSRFDALVRKVGMADQSSGVR